MVKSKKKSKYKTKSFKCFVEFNDSKYVVKIDKCFAEWIRFDRVLENISQTIGLNVNLETHSFEVFEEIFKVYIKLRFSDSLIKNRSLIRVSHHLDSNSQLIQTKSILKVNESQTEIESNGTVGSETSSQKSTRNVCSSELKTSLAFCQNKSSDEDLIDRSLAQTVGQCLVENSQLLVTNSTLFWQMVSHKMKTEFQMKGMDEYESQIRFEELLYKYLNLKESTDCFDAITSDWICLDYLKTVDLSLFLDLDSYPSIDTNRKSIVEQNGDKAVEENGEELLIDLSSDENVNPIITNKLVNSEVVADCSEDKSSLLMVTDGQDMNEVQHNISSIDNSIQDLEQLREERKRRNRERQLKSKLSPAEKLRFNAILVDAIYELELESRFSWTLVSQTIKTSGFNGFDERMCKNRFGAVISKYINVMKDCHSERKASTLWPPFVHMNAIDLKTFVNENTYDKIEWLKQKFESKRLTINSIESTDESIQSELICNDLIETTEEPIGSELNSNNLKESVKEPIGSELMSNKLIETAKELNGSELISNNLKELVKKPIKSELINNNSIELANELTANQLNWKYNDIKNYFLVKLISDLQLDSVEKNLIPFWHLITYKMIFSYNFKNQGLTPIECKKRFNRLVNKYIDVLQTARSLEEARNQMICFDYLDKILNKFDSKLYSNSDVYQTVVELKNEFTITDNGYKSEDFLSNVSHPSTSSADQLANDLSVDQNSDLTQIPFTYKAMEANRRQEFQNFCFDIKFQKLIQIELIDQNALQTELIKTSSLTNQICVFRRMVLLKRKEVKTRTQLKNILERVLKESGIECVVHIFGSTVNSTGFRDSDLNLFIEFQELNNYFVEMDPKLAMSCITVLKNIFADCLGLDIPEPTIPQITIDFRNQQKFQKSQNYWEIQEYLRRICCNITVTNGLALRNTRLVELYCEYKKRFQDLALILKFWAKNNGFIGSNAFTSYAFTQLVIFYAQNLNPPLLPTLTQLRQLTKESLIVNGWETSFCDQKRASLKSRNKEEILQLLPNFFKFYANFNFLTQVIQTKTGLTVPKTSKGTTNSYISSDSFSSFLIGIEDPFNTNENLSQNLDPIVFYRFVKQIKEIASKSDLIFSPIKSNCWGISKIIIRFDSSKYGYYATNFDHNPCPPVPDNTVSAITALIKGQSEYGFLEQIMTDEFCETTRSLLESVFQIKCELIAKYDIQFKEYSLFAYFMMDMNEYNLEIIDSNNRQTVGGHLERLLNSKTVFNREKEISEEVSALYARQELPKTCIKCRFRLYYKDCIKPTIDYKIIDLSSDNTRALQLVNNFLNTLIELIPQIIDENYSNF